MTRRTHSTIDQLPEDLRQTITRMVVDAQWPDDYTPADDADGVKNGKPRYVDIVAYCLDKGWPVSLSSLGRWAKGLQAFERMRTAAGLAKQIMADVKDENASESHKAAAEIITAQIIDLAAKEDLSPKDIAMIASAVRANAETVMRADRYQREQSKAKAAQAVKVLDAVAKKKNIDPETLKMIREQIYGIVS
jgi:uncharacterized protein (UPF0147 family)